MDVDAAHRQRGALLAAVGAVALALGGWWWQTEAPTPAPPGVLGGVEVVRDGSSSASYWTRTGAVIGTSGATVGSAAAGAGRPGRWRVGGGDPVWTERARLGSGDAVVRYNRIANGERHLLRFSCTGPGELLVGVRGARAAAPMTVGCDGAVAMMEITGTGAPVWVSFSLAGSQPVQVEARLIAPR
ncbi:hypothetical protein [Micromonospora sp. WMMD1082]|uniref:hypothetical protein n=1 Tax=Micromonospora sp. WMMD1082 TaxID=3016104 RepID=UPI002416B652|nr:hypothetical protein [Micromonospora sp. WMMD1082]MDG4794317.1 hypothetical protein [Micromonospora sp. WMMD1082]